MKRIISVLLVIFFVINIPAFAEPEKISDWARGDVQEAISLGFVPEDMQNDYQKPVTRGEFAKISITFLSCKLNMSVDEFVKWYLASHKDSEGNELSFSEDSFSDIKGSQYEYYIKCAKSIKIAYGRGNGIFDPDGLITREEAAAMLLRVYFCYGSGVKIGPLSEKVDEFEDAERISSWADTAVRYMYQWGVMKGVSDTHYKPELHYTKEQCYSTFLRLYKVY